jgi:hypothetical protein
MNRPLRVLAVILVGLIAGCASRKNQTEGPYIGTWYAQGRDPSLTWKLAEDGGYGEANGFVTPETNDGSWSVEDGDLIINKKSDGDGKPQHLKAKVVGNTLTVDQPGGPLIFTRVAK